MSEIASLDFREDKFTRFFLSVLVTILIKRKFMNFIELEL